MRRRAAIPAGKNTGSNEIERDCVKRKTVFSLLRMDKLLISRDLRSFTRFAEP
jgi:hypothetical protein